MNQELIILKIRLYYVNPARAVYKRFFGKISLPLHLYLSAGQGKKRIPLGGIQGGLFYLGGQQ